MSFRQSPVSRGISFVAIMLVLAACASATAARDRLSPPVMLVHGWAGDAILWQPVLDRLRGGAVAIDLPGHGKDTTDVQGWAMDRFVAAMERDREALGAKCLVLVGHSNGAYFVRAYAHRFPDRVAAIVIIEGTFLRPFDSVEQLRSRRAAIERGWDAMLEHPFGLEHATASTRAAVQSAMQRASKATALATLDLLQDPMLWRSDPITVPVVFMLARSPFWTASHRLKLSEIASKARFVDLGAVSHYAILDAVDRVAQEITKVRQSARCPR